MTKAIAVVSGGLDSVTLAYRLKYDKDCDLHLVSFNYGQRHQKELLYAHKCSLELETKFTIIDLTSIPLLGSSLTDTIEVPNGHYAEESMKITIVPNRNAIMLSIAYGIAVSEKVDYVAIGVHSGDHYIYPDCRPEFIYSIEKTLQLANESKVKLYTPYLHLTKADIVFEANRLNVPFEDTWSCYKGLDYHCGKCGTCTERIEAFELAGIKDTTIYRGNNE